MNFKNFKKEIQKNQYNKKRSPVILPHKINLDCVPSERQRKKRDSNLTPDNIKSVFPHVNKHFVLYYC